MIQADVPLTKVDSDSGINFPALFNICFPVTLADERKLEIPVDDNITIINILNNFRYLLHKVYWAYSRYIQKVER